MMILSSGIKTIPRKTRHQCDLNTKLPLAILTIDQPVKAIKSLFRPWFKSPTVQNFTHLQANIVLTLVRLPPCPFYLPFFRRLPFEI